MRRFKITLVSLFIAFFVSACGGGGGGSTDGSQSQNGNGNTQGTQQQIEKFSAQASAFAYSYEEAQKSLFKTFSDITNGYTKDFDASKLTSQETSDFMLNVYLTQQLFLLSTLEGYKAVELSDGISANQVGYKKRALVGTAVTVASAAITVAQAFTGIAKALGKNTALALYWINEMPANRLPEIAKKVGLDPSKSREALMKELVNLGVSQKFTKSNAIVRLATVYVDDDDPTMSDVALTVAERRRDNIAEIAGGLGQVALSATTNTYISIAGGQGVDKATEAVAKSSGLSAKVSKYLGKLTDFFTTATGNQPLDQVEKHVTAVQVSKKKKRIKIKKSKKTIVEAKKIIKQVLNDYNTTKTTKDLNDSVNKLKVDLAKKAKAIKSESKDDIEAEIPEKIAVYKEKKIKNGDTIKVPDIGLSDIISIVGTKVVNIIENVKTGISQTIDMLGNSTQVSGGDQSGNGDQNAGFSVTYKINEKALYHIYYIVTIKTDKPNTKVTLTDADQHKNIATNSGGVYNIRIKVAKDDRAVKFYNHVTSKSKTITFEGINSTYPERLGTWVVDISSSTCPKDEIRVGDSFTASIHKDGAIRLSGTRIGTHNNFAVGGGFRDGKFKGSFSGGKWIENIEEVNEKPCVAYFSGSLSLNI